MVTGKLVATSSEAGLSAALTRLIARGGEPVIRRGVDMAMRMMGEQFVTGQTIDEALANSRKMEARGFRYSYDMLGEAATTADDAARYYRDYEQAIHAIGRASAGRGIVEGPGISVKLSALHPRYSRAQRDRVMAELLPRLPVADGAGAALRHRPEHRRRGSRPAGICRSTCWRRCASTPALAGWNGIGFVVQAYQKRAPFVLDLVIDLARRSGHRLMLRLVKGAYWDSEIKRAQVDGLEDFPVFTRKVHTDVSYLACARKLLDARDAVFPQFATHNAYTLAAVHSMAGEEFRVGDYEFQCLHGMGEPLYEEVVGAEQAEPPVPHLRAGRHARDAAGLSGAPAAGERRQHVVRQPHQGPGGAELDALIADPVGARLRSARRIRRSRCRAVVRRRAGQFGGLRSVGRAECWRSWRECCVKSRPHRMAGLTRSLPARHEVPGAIAAGTSRDATRPTSATSSAMSSKPTPPQIDRALAAAAAAASAWQATPPAERARLPVPRRRPAGSSACRSLLGPDRARGRQVLPQRRRRGARGGRFPALLRRHRRAIASTTPRIVPLGPVVCISPWNFPLAIFTGQVAAALAAGNPVLAKPAEETPLIAAQAVAILHEAGVPADAVQLLPGPGRSRRALVGDRAHAGRDVHRLDRGRAADPAPACRTARPRRRARSR